MTGQEIRSLKVGDWVSVEYGCKREMLYVLIVAQEGVMLGNPRWWLNDAVVVTYNELISYRNPILLGHTEKHWWWRFLPWRSAVCPFKRLI
jgi:hypothetical protein